MAEKLFLSGKTRLAIDVAHKVYEADTSFHLLTKLASLYRRQGDADEAVTLFRNLGYYPSHRGFYFEWGVCEGIQRNATENALLATYSLSDQSETDSLMVENARMYLSGLSKCCDRLHISFADPIFSEAESACNSLLTILQKNDKTGKSESKELISNFAKDVARRRKKLYGRSEAIAIISDMTRTLAQYGIASEVLQIYDANSMSFMSLDRIIRNVESLQ